MPELAASRRWVDTGRRILLAEISRQIHADGGHVERSTHYQRYALDFYLLALLMAERTDDLVAIPRFRDAVTRLADFTRTLADDDGRLPLIGDDDGGMLWPIAGRACSDVRDSLALAALVIGRPDLAPWGAPEEVVWIAGRAPIDDGALDEKEKLAPLADHEGPRHMTSRAGTASRTLADTGYVVMRDGGGGHAVFDAGAHGYLNGGHAHADALALTLTLAGRPLLVDPGTSTYTVDPRLRDRLRGGTSHNTVTLDDQPQALPGGPFQWRTRANGRLYAWRHNAAFDWAEASHDGYAPLRHLRLIFRSARSGWLIVDEVTGGGRHSASACWHFDPAWTVACDAPGRLHVVHLDGDAAWLLHDGDEAELVHGDEGRGLGWYAPVYGTLVPTWTARVTRDGVTPFAMVTWIGMSDPHQSDPPCLERVATACEAGERVVGVRIVATDRTSTFLLRAEDPAKGDTRTCGIQDYETDARALHCLEHCGELVALELVDTSYAVTSRTEGTSITASETVADLHAAVDGPALELFASAPPSQLRIEGGAMRRTRVVRANGREMPRDGLGTGAVTIERGQWGPHPSRRPDPAGRTAPALAT
ncbi:MAG: alginate lyase family protein [Acidobacteria bacterium]|nr:alginate lyase family protein [Acidobacteriota bacterium]